MATRRHLDAAELAVVVEDAFHFAPVVMRFVIVAAVDTSYVAAASADADAAIVAADAATAASAYADAGCAFGDAFEIQREVGYPTHRGRLDDRQRLLEVCNWHRRWGWTDVRWGLTYVPCEPYRCSEMSTCNRPCRPYFRRAPVDADNKPRFACQSGCTGETSDKACPADLPRFLHNGERTLPGVTNSDHRDHQLAGAVAVPTVSAVAPVRPHRSAADADENVPPRHFAGPGCTNSRSTNSCYCPTCPTC